MQGLHTKNLLKLKRNPKSCDKNTMNKRNDVVNIDEFNLPSVT